MGEAKRRQQYDLNYGKSKQKKFVIQLGDFFDVSSAGAYVSGTVDTPETSSFGVQIWSSGKYLQAAVARAGCEQAKILLRMSKALNNL